jgi:hypothetical protein
MTSRTAKLLTKASTMAMFDSSRGPSGAPRTVTL